MTTQRTISSTSDSTGGALDIRQQGDGFVFLVRDGNGIEREAYVTGAAARSLARWVLDKA